jgi:hypothetical protein
MLRLTFHIDLEPDPTLEGALLARVRELPEMTTSLRSDENPIRVIESLVTSFFIDMSKLGRLDEVLARLGHVVDRTPRSGLVAEYILHREHQIQL